MVKVCSKCKVEKPTTEFYSNRTNGRVYLRADCKACNNVKTKAYYMANQERLRAAMKEYDARNASTLTNARLVREYGITLEQYVALLVEQEGKCAVCRKIPETKRALAVDHDHGCCPGKRSCGKCIRGLLCTSCNTGLGNFRDSPELLAAASAYLVH